ncbi:MAG TPA: response regulator [Syntrophobacteraceae bacterium]|jgi:two-component system, chemotaxis family, chemotaxis protein CheY|nr:response regulator [Syntrophobacteraceae bacterium]HBZ55386.1 response regulator [Syntrophobacteraceae bacterium]
MPYNVLIVDDSGTMRNVIKKVLRLTGISFGSCLEAGNGQEAMDILESNWVDLILSDINMPVMDGFGLLRAIKSQPSFQDVPVVLITTESNEKRLQEAMRLGAKGYIHKPFTPETVRSLVKDVMGEADESAMPDSDEGCDF